MVLLRSQRHLFNGVDFLTLPKITSKRQGMVERGVAFRAQGSRHILCVFTDAVAARLIFVNHHSLLREGDGERGELQEG